MVKSSESIGQLRLMIGYHKSMSEKSKSLTHKSKTNVISLRHDQ